MQKRHLAAQLLSYKGVDRESVLAQLENYPKELEIMTLSEMGEELGKSPEAVWSRVRKLRRHGVQVGVSYRHYHVYTTQDFQKVKESYEKDYVYPSNAAAQRPDVLGAPQ